MKCKKEKTKKAVKITSYFALKPHQTIQQNINSKYL